MSIIEDGLEYCDHCGELLINCTCDGTGVIYAWPDGAWCEPCDLEKMLQGRSDDYVRLEVPNAVWNHPDIDRLEKYVLAHV